MKRRFEFSVDETAIGKRMDYFLLDRLNTDRNFSVSRKSVRKMIEGGNVFLNRHRAKITTITLALDDKISLQIDPKQLKQKDIHISFELTEDRIVYEDASIIVLNKPAGLPTQGTLDPSRDHLFAAVQRFLKQRNPSREIYVGLHHRLDRDTSGLVLMTKKKSANKAVSEIFANREALKEYVAICHKNPDFDKPRWSVRNHLARSKNHRMQMEEVQAGGDQAITTFKLAKDYGNILLVEAKPKTGRMHQIRVHLAGLGMPIIGDTIYCPIEKDKALDKKPKRCMLHAARLTFPHPVSKKLLCLEAPLPADFRSYLNLQNR
tara:strand:- start:31918 stop:32877 length:960 start_codon:yes stop_codon:yes gene_type:complete